MEVLSSRLVVHPRDFAASRHFYEDLLGLRLYHEYGDGERVIGAVYFVGGGHLELAATSPGADPGATKLWLQVPDLAAEQRRLDAVGVTIDERASLMPWGLKELGLRDPDGLAITLVEVPEDHFLRLRL